MIAYFFREIGNVPPAFVANFPPRAWGVDIGHLLVQGKRTSGLMEMMDQIISCKSHIYICIYIYTISLGLVSSSQVLDGKVQ